MSSVESLLKATMNRLLIRLEEKARDAASKLSEIVEEAPEKLREEFDTFQEEVLVEAERLETESQQDQSSDPQARKKSHNNSTQQTIDRLRGKVSIISKKVEVRN